MKKRYWGRCKVCADEVWTPRDTPAFPVAGWEVLRDGGGANKILGRTRVEGVVAHDRCVEREVDRERSGINPAQETLA